MKIYLMNANNGKDNKYIGDSKDFPIPRIGEGVNVGLIEYPTVKTVIYDYENNFISVVIHATLKHMKLA